MTDLTGQIGLVQHPMRFWPRAIAWDTHSTTYHTVLAVDNTRVVSEEPGGAVFRPINYWRNTVWSHYDLTQAQRDDITDWGVKHLGTPYGYFSDAADFLALTFDMRTPQWVERYLSSEYVMNCSQFCASAYRDAGRDLFPDAVLPAAVYPGMFEPLWRAEGWM